MFCILVSGFPEMTIPFLLSSSTTVSTTSFACRSDLEPVQTIFPVLKRSVAVFGFFNLKTSPGNDSGLYSTPGNARTMELRSKSCPRVADATTFCISVSAFLFTKNS